MSHCSGKSKAIVSYTKPDGSAIAYSTDKVPVDVSVKKVITGTYRFYGTGDDGIFYQFTATGTNPGYAINSSFNGRGYTPTMDGVFIQPQYYYYVSGYGIETLSTTEEVCTINVTGSGNNFNDTIRCPNGSYKVSCDDDCPEGSHKCIHNKYPGYCCVPCKEVGDRLKNIANKVGR